MKPYEQIMQDKDIGIAFEYLIQRAKTVREYNMLNMMNEEWDLREYGQIVEQKHGHWIRIEPTFENGMAISRLECSECGSVHFDESNFCFSCGARMDEVTEDVHL